MKARPGTNQPLPDGEQITDPTRVARLLERLAKQHSLLTIVIPGHEEHFTSSIVEVKGPHVLIDELLPNNGHQLLLAERKLQVTGKLDGIEIRFSTTLEHVDDQDGVITYHANLPGRLEYRQRRQNYRAHIPMARRLRVIVDSHDGTVCEGELHDLSIGGTGIIFTDVMPAVERGVLHECAVELPDGGWLYCTVELRHLITIPPRDRHLVGARFARLTVVQARIVGQCIGELERESIRKRVAD